MTIQLGFEPEDFTLRTWRAVAAEFIATGLFVFLGTGTVAANVWDDHWVYWLGPLIGAAIAALIYEFVFVRAEDDARSESAQRSTALVNMSERRE